MLTIAVQGGGGAVFAMDVPPSGERRKLVEYQLGKGELVLVGPDADGVAFVEGRLVELAHVEEDPDAGSAADAGSADGGGASASDNGGDGLSRDDLLRMAADLELEVNASWNTATLRRRVTDALEARG